MQRLGVIDGSLVAAQFSLWRGAAPAEVVLSCVGRLDKVGFDALDIMDGPVFRHCVERGIDPWAWIRAGAARARLTPLNAWVSATTLFGPMPLPQDALARGLACLAASGVGRLTCYDAFNDPTTLIRFAKTARAAGIKCCAALVFTNSAAGARIPEMARQVAGRFDSVCLWDPAGAMSPETARELLPLLVEQCGEVALELRTHCQSGRAEVTYLDAVAAGVRTLHTAVEALAGGMSLPSFEHLVRTARGGLRHVDGETAAGTSEYCAGFAERNRLLVGRHHLADPDAERFEIPADLVRDLDAFTAAGIDRQTLQEQTRRLRDEVGGATLVYPLGGLLLRQAARSIQDREATLPSDPRAGETTMADGALVESLRSGATPAAAATLEETACIGGGDETLLIAAMFGPRLAETLRTSATPADLLSIQADTPLGFLIGELTRRPQVRAIAVTKGDWRFELET